jgi:ubiquinone/menaquinone biosynthesis C-methylase UbiE
MSSKEYFNNVANEWDTMRQSFFSESVREKIYQVAEVEKGRTVADLGAGTGFITEGLIKNGVNVIAVDQSIAMLQKLEEKFLSSGLVKCLNGEAENLPIEDNSVDYAMANMYLHHVETPLAAIREMVRILKPGGKVVITDLDEHSFEFLKTEQHDKWMGFKRDDIKKWFSDAGLTNVTIECVGEDCCATSTCSNQNASISIFIAYGEK